MTSAGKLGFGVITDIADFDHDRRRRGRAAAEVVVLLEPAVAAFEREAALALERAPARAG